ncbi:hypothetical protein COEX109129_34340 [Corallococcus exiguus]
MGQSTSDSTMAHAEPPSTARPDSSACTTLSAGSPSAMTKVVAAMLPVMFDAAPYTPAKLHAVTHSRVAGMARAGCIPARPPSTADTAAASAVPPMARKRAW